MTLPRRRGRTRVAALALVVAFALVGCTPGAAKDPLTGPDSSGPGGSSGESKKGQPAAPGSAVLNTSGSAVTAVTSDDPVDLSVQVSRALFASAPVAVVAPSDDDAALQEGTSQAGRMGVPLLVLGPGPAPATPALAAEVTRLGVRTVLGTGSAASRLNSLAKVKVVEDAGKLPDVAPASAAGTAVLTRPAKKSRPALSAVSTNLAIAAAAAASTKLLVVSTKDVRAAPKAISELARQKPERVLAIGDFGSTKRLAERVAVATTGVQLPGGGQVLLPGRRFVALYGHPDTSALGVLGEQGPAASVARAKKLAKQYAPLSKVPVVPTFEIIATTLQGSPGPDGDYSFETPIKTLRPWVEQASKSGVYVVLDLQPGRADFLSQAKRYESLLKLPNVGLALDPEWRLGPNQRPLVQIGGVDAAEINRVSDWLADLTAKNTLPQKLLVLHQFQLQMIRNEKKLDTSHDELQLLIHMDGQGSPDLKEGTWRAVVAAAPKGMPFGWKNFYDEDHPMLTPKQTMAKRPTPDMISYQ